MNVLNKCRIIFNGGDIEQGELLTVDHLHRFCNHYIGKIWYIHTKGVSRPSNPHVQDWRRYMEHFVITRYKDCVEALEAHDACGVEWFEVNDPLFWKVYYCENNSHFAGNFWWANSDYIKSLPPLDIYGSRMDAETFIARNKPKSKCFHHSMVNHYRKAYPLAKYVKIPFI